MSCARRRSLRFRWTTRTLSCAASCPSSRTRPSRCGQCLYACARASGSARECALRLWADRGRSQSPSQLELAGYNTGYTVGKTIFILMDLYHTTLEKYIERRLAASQPLKVGVASTVALAAAE